MNMRHRSLRYYKRSSSTSTPLPRKRQSLRMKIKITLLIAKIVKNLPLSDPRRLQLYLCDSMKLPQGHMSTRDEKETINNIVSKYFYVDPSWLNINLAAFRKLSDSESEVTYTIIIPDMSGISKSGYFFSYKDLKRLDAEIDEYYEPVLSRWSR